MSASARRNLLSTEGRVVKEAIGFRGHPMVRSLHPTTIEVTTESHLTEKGDCIIGVGATKGCLQLSEEVKEGAQKEGFAGDNQNRGRVWNERCLPPGVF